MGLFDEFGTDLGGLLGEGSTDWMDLLANMGLDQSGGDMVYDTLTGQMVDAAGIDRSLIDDANAAAALTTLGSSSAASANIRAVSRSVSSMPSSSIADSRLFICSFTSIMLSCAACMRSVIDRRL